MKNKILRKITIALALLLVITTSRLIDWNYFTGSFLLTKAYAATTTYSAKLISVEPKNIQGQPGQELELTLTYQNTGNVAWQRDIFNFTAVSTAGPLMHESKFAPASWETKFRPTRIVEKEVKPGQAGTFKFKLKMPAKIGNYNESFILVVRRISWIDNSQTKINFTVIQSATNKETSNNITNALQADSQSLPTKQAILDPTPEQQVKLRQALDDYYQQKRELEVAASEAQIEPTDANLTPTASQIQPSDGPLIRVGLYDTQKSIEVTATRPYTVNWATKPLAEIKAGDKVVLSYNFDNQTYQALLPNGELKQSATFPTLTSNDDNIVFKILNYDNSLPWNSSVNDNRFRHKLELRYAEKTGKLWVINELPMEYYVKGVAEVANQSPSEYLKAMAIAIRTYTYYHYNKGLMYIVKDGSTKHADEHFHVDSLYDQIYRGYGVEERLTNYNQAVDQTKGQVLKYQDRIAITPYFSRSDGRTRSFKEVWNNDVPWLVSVPTLYDQSDLYGHGVGMACTDAYRWADNNNGQYEQILKYYYTGVDITNQY